MGDAQADAAERSDGRTARRDRNREAVLDAVLDLFRDESVPITPATVAERSGVSLRSVYRYFDDMDALVRAAMSRNMERFRPLFVLDGLGEGPVTDRVARIVAQRVRLHEVVGPTARAAVLRGGANPLIGERLDVARRELTAQVEEMFAPELGAVDDSERRRMAAGLDLILGLESLTYLSRTRALPADEVSATLERSVLALVRA